MKEMLVASTLAGLATGLGALPFLFIKRVPHWLRDGMLGFAGGVMVSASAFSLLGSALELGSLQEVVLGIFVGALVLGVMDQTLPHLHPGELHNSDEAYKVWRRALLMIVAITLHNIPEGLAMGVGYASGEAGMGLLLAVAIAAQNAPEGLVVAAPLREKGLKVWQVIAIATATGLVEPIAAILGYMLVGLTTGLLPFALAFAAGAMLFVVSSELIPESHGHGHEIISTMAFILGFVLMLILDGILG